MAEVVLVFSPTVLMGIGPLASVDVRPVKLIESAKPEKWPAYRLYELPNGMWVQCAKKKKEACGTWLSECADGRAYACIPSAKDLGLIDLN